MAKSDYLENELLDHIFGFGTTDFTPPADMYLALYTVTPTDAGGGTEVTGGGYARVATDEGDWPASASGSVANTAALAYAGPVSADWGTIVAFGLFDALTVGNLMYWGALSNNITVSNGDAAPEFAIGTITVTED